MKTILVDEVIWASCHEITVFFSLMFRRYYSSHAYLYYNVQVLFQSDFG
jgi:hypothetical protein